MEQDVIFGDGKTSEGQCAEWEKNKQVKTKVWGMLHRGVESCERRPHNKRQGNSRVSHNVQIIKSVRSGN